MRHFSRILILTGAIVTALTIAASAQMGMSNDKGKMMPMMKDSSSHMMRMADDSRMLMDEYGKIQADFDRIMKINDQKEMKAEMAKHKKMMAEFQMKLRHHSDMYQAMEGQVQEGMMHHDMKPTKSKAMDNSKAKKDDNK